MNKVILLALLMPVMAFGQIMEDFESGNANNWIQSPEGRWIADNNGSISGIYSLHHSFDNPAAGNDLAGLRIKNLCPSEGITKWDFRIRHGYDPSSSNNWVLFLMSDSDPESLLQNKNCNGFAIGVNQTGSDDILRLWKVKQGAFIAVVNTKVNWQSDIGIAEAARVTVERSQEGIWSISAFNADESLAGMASGNDPELFIPAWFILSYKYSSTADRLLWLDDIIVEGVFREDNEAPEVTHIEVAGKNSVTITFNEEPRTDIMVPSNFRISPGNIIARSIVKANVATYIVQFDDQFINKTTNELHINNLCDREGNCRKNISVEFIPVWPGPGDVVITEIMADPVPAVSLPAKEYLEIKNLTDYRLNLHGWKLTTTDQSIDFTREIILPYENMIICAVNDTALLSGYGSTTGLKPFPTLTDGGKIIALQNSEGDLISGVEYSSSWYNNELKAEGGWSLELIDADYPFCQDGNWTASISRSGGTPGHDNSVSRYNPDMSFFGIINVFPYDSNNVRVKFSETVFDFTARPDVIMIDDIKINDICPVDLLLREFLLKPGKSLKRGNIHSFILPDDICDFAGNRIEKRRFDFGIPEPAIKGDVMFNELLFNPLPGDPDYIEFFNCSDKVIDVSRLLLVSVNDATADTSGFIQVFPENRCLLPGDYFTVTTDKKRLTERYFSSDPDRIFEIKSLPSMPDDKGHLLLLNRELDIIDEVYYQDKMQYSLLSNNEGVALEKIRPESLSSDRSNWHSASGSSGWGTPGAPNSVHSEMPVNEDIVILSSTKITPNNDGFEDVLLIDLSLTGSGNVVSVEIFDETGCFVRKLANNLLSNRQLTLIWDSTAEDGGLVRTGIYIIFVSVYNDSGKKKSWKKICTVIID